MKKTLAKEIPTDPAKPGPGRGSMVVLVGGLCIWLCFIGLIHVLTINRIHELVDEQRKLKLETAELTRQRDNEQGKIDDALSKKNLEDKLSDRRSN